MVRFSYTKKSEFPSFQLEILTGMPPEVGPSTRKVGRTPLAPSSKSTMAAPLINSVKVVVISCLLAVLSFFVCH